MRKILIIIIAIVGALQMVSCGAMHSKQLEGTWETTVPYYDNVKENE